MMFFAGMVKPFTKAANFSRIALFNSALKLSDIVHKAFLEVKNGLEAAPNPGAAQEGFVSDYSLWTRQPKVNILFSESIVVFIFRPK